MKYLTEGLTDIVIMHRNSSEESWKNMIIPNFIPPLNNNIFWEGLTSSNYLTEIKEFSPIKGKLPSERLNKRKEISPIANPIKKPKEN